MNRRTLLQAVGTTGLTSLAGCAGMLSNTSESNSTTTPTTQTQGAIKDTSIDGTKLVVSLSSEADVEKVNVIGPNGSPSLGSQSIPTGSTKASFNVLQSVPRGTHRAVAVSSGEVVGEASVDLHPNVEIDRVATWLQTDDVEWPTGEKYFQAYLELSNTGTTPQQITFLGMPGVPGSWPKRSATSFSGLQTLEGDRLKNVVLHPGETRQFFTVDGPFLFGTEFTCGDSTELSVVLSTKIGANVKNSYRLVTEDPDDPQKACRQYVKPQ
ncbi:hypothetical protein [Halorussus sp. MSC15.2]|uniref:hypothetical protein n=1 Tax=Halorussus sp. MSC15.2 TaxID=2283638 RepID=UPI0013CF74EF|nr:hypothetical protein [Halorussus sp. MSC15.2]NEU59228.1 hypothetical protein [Halorussus sp. MSC15.2]